MSTAMPRRNLFKLGAGALAGATLVPAAATAEARPGEAAKNESIVRKYYKLWEQKDWAPLGALLADDFTFTSPQDDHIDLAAFKKNCWGTQIGFIKGFDLEVVMAKDELGHGRIPLPHRKRKGPAQRGDQSFARQQDRLDRVLFRRQRQLSVRGERAEELACARLNRPTGRDDGCRRGRFRRGGGRPPWRPSHRRCVRQGRRGRRRPAGGRGARCRLRRTDTGAVCRGR